MNRNTPPLLFVNYSLTRKPHCRQTSVKGTVQYPCVSAFPNCGLPTGDFGVCIYISLLTRETSERCRARGIGARTQPNRV